LFAGGLPRLPPIMQGLGGTGAQQSKDCAFDAGSLLGAPLKISWFLVIFFVYQLIDAVNAKGLPVWVRVVTVTGNEFLLLLTVLCHEMGHGTMARRRGGDIAEVLLWPFGGICFTTRAQGRAPKQKLVDDLWIVGAGPATHFPMTLIWWALLAMFVALCGEIEISPAWQHIVPFSSTVSPCMDPAGLATQCFHSWFGYLTHAFMVQGIQLNVMLFLFNVFFPMYPMDGAKLIVCSLQLFCGASARCSAKVLVYTSVPLAVLFIGNSFFGMKGGGGLQPGITMYMGIMCLAESYKIYKLMKDERLYTHPLFELARSSTREVDDGNGIARRLNPSDRDDEERAGGGGVPASARAPVVTSMELKPFSGSGRALGGEGATSSSAAAGGVAGGTTLGSAAVPSKDASAAGGGAGGRAAWLASVELGQAERTKTVRQLEEERIALQKLERERLTGRP